MVPHDIISRNTDRKFSRDLEFRGTVPMAFCKFLVWLPNYFGNLCSNISALLAEGG